MARPKPALVLSDDEQQTLTRWANRTKSTPRLALRARIVLACFDEPSNKAVAEQLGVCAATRSAGNTLHDLRGEDEAPLGIDLRYVGRHVPEQHLRRFQPVQLPDPRREQVPQPVRVPVVPAPLRQPPPLVLGHPSRIRVDHQMTRERRLARFFSVLSPVAADLFIASCKSSCTPASAPAPAPGSSAGPVQMPGASELRYTSAARRATRRKK